MSHEIPESTILDIDNGYVSEEIFIIVGISPNIYRLVLNGKEDLLEC